MRLTFSGLFATLWLAGWSPLHADEPPAPADFVAVPAAGEVPFQLTDAEPQVPERFRLTEHTFPFETATQQIRPRVRVLRLTFPSPVQTAVPENNVVHAEYYQPAGNGPFPGAVVLHILGGSFPLSQTVARTLAHRGIATLFVKLPYYGERRGPNSPQRMISRNPDETAAGITQGVLDIRRAGAWLAARPEIDANRLGVTGISLGGLMSAVSAAAEPRFSYVAIHVAGGNLAEMAWSSDRPGAEEFRRQWVEMGGTKESFFAAIAPVDPVTNAHLLRGRRVLIVAAEKDEIFSQASTRALWTAAGQPPLVWMKDVGHYSAALYLPREIHRLGNFFLDVDQPEPAAVRTPPLPRE